MIDIQVADKAVRDRIVDAVCGQYKRPEKVIVGGVEVDNPVSKVDFTRNVVKSFLKEVVRVYETVKTDEDAKQIAKSMVKPEVDF